MLIEMNPRNASQNLEYSLPSPPDREGSLLGRIVNTETLKDSFPRGLFVAMGVCMVTSSSIFFIRMQDPDHIQDNVLVTAFAIFSMITGAGLVIGGCCIPTPRAPDYSLEIS